MDFQIPAIDPLYAVGGNVPTSRIKTKEESQQEFVSMFLQQIMKDVFKAQSTMFGDEGSLGMFSDNMYNDIFLSKISKDLASSPSMGLDKLFEGNSKWL